MEASAMLNVCVFKVLQDFLLCFIQNGEFTF